ncbi:MAG TPA: anti-sigma factor [Steroidobacteraceae bacterium]|nr:anti-sigma factor [Steroidobacteraceae bacterium]
MTISSDEGIPDLRYAEYVLGVLDAQGRDQVEREMAESEAAAAAVERWRRRLLPLAQEIPPESPPAHLWQRIRGELQLVAPGAPEQGARPGVWESLRFWHRFSLVTGALLAAACVAIVALVLRRPAAPPIPYMASTITESGGRVGWTATMDIAKARMIVVPAAPQGVRAGRSPELWLIPHGGKPIAVGVISATSPITIRLAPALLAELGPTAVLAVSVEPRGGSPTGRPTGPVIGQGSIGAAPAGNHAADAATAMLISLPDSALG